MGSESQPRRSVAVTAVSLPVTVALLLAPEAMVGQCHCAATASGPLKSVLSRTRQVAVPGGTQR